MTFDLTKYDPQTGSIVDGRCTICREDATYHDSLHVCDDGKEPPIEDFWYCKTHALQEQARINSKLGIEPNWPRQLQSARRWQAKVEPFYPYQATPAEIETMRLKRQAYLKRKAEEREHGSAVVTGPQQLFEEDVIAAVATSKSPTLEQMLEDAEHVLEQLAAEPPRPARHILQVVDEE